MKRAAEERQCMPHQTLVAKEQPLLAAQGVASDHVPAKQLGIKSAWISTNPPGTEQIYDGREPRQS